MFSKQQRFNIQPLQKVSRNLVRELLKSNTLDEKLVLSRSFILSKKLKGRVINDAQSSLSQYRQTRESQDQKNKVDRSTQTDQIFQDTKPFKDTDLVQTTSSQFCYLKQTHQIFTQTNDNTEPKPEQGTIIQSLKQFKLQIKSQSTLATQQQEFEETNLQQYSNTQQCLLKSSFIKKKTKNQQQKLSQSLTQEVTELKKHIESLKVQISDIDEQKNKWKKKFLKYSSKIKAIESEQTRFEKAYKQSTNLK